MNDPNYNFGKYVAQVFSHDLYRLLHSIYMAYIEPKKDLPQVVMGVIDEVNSYKGRIGVLAKHEIGLINEYLKINKSE